MKEARGGGGEKGREAGDEKARRDEGHTNTIFFE